MPHISINFILSTFNCEEIKHFSFRRGMCSGNSTNSQYPVTMEDKKPHNIHWHSWEPRYQRLQKYAHKRLNLVFLGREVECNSCKHWAAEVCATSAWYWQSCYKPLLISASTSTNPVTEINSLFTYLSIQPLCLPLLRNYLQRLTGIRACAAMGEDKGC